MHIDPQDMPKTEAEWKARLTPEQYEVLREKGTEAPFSGKYDTVYEDGIYKCAACGNPLFTSDAKYDAGCGWPSFFKTVAPDAVKLSDDFSHGMHRIEVTCGRCGGHLGHLFDDGPMDKGGQRYCINSVSLDMEKK